MRTGQTGWQSHYDARAVAADADATGGRTCWLCTLLLD